MTTLIEAISKQSSLSLCVSLTIKTFCRPPPVLRLVLIPPWNSATQQGDLERSKYKATFVPSLAKNELTVEGDASIYVTAKLQAEQPKANQPPKHKVIKPSQPTSQPTNQPLIHCSY